MHAGTEYGTTGTMTGAGMTSGAGEHLSGGFGTGALAAQYQEPSYQGVPLTTVGGVNVSGMTGTGMTGTPAGMSTGDKIKSKVRRLLPSHHELACSELPKLVGPLSSG